MPRFKCRTMCREDKTALRRGWKGRRAEIPDREGKSREIGKQILGLPKVMDAKTVFAYLSFGSEVETHGLIKELLSMGKRVAIPVCDPQTHTMEAVEIGDITSLKPSTYGILEPDSTAKRVPKKEVDIVIVPGLAFDKERFRLGYGGGYYDRYLEGFAGTSIGICFQDCLTDRLPRGEYDKPTDMVMTEKGLV